MRGKKTVALTPRTVAVTRGAIVVARDHVLSYAKALTVDAHTPAAVVANAKVLLDWLEVTDAADHDTRQRALSQAHHSRSHRRAPDDRPDLLIAEAEVFYAFLKAA
jgi:hypothetical protein